LKKLEFEQFHGAAASQKKF